MSLRKSRLSFDGKFAQIPNAWLRDSRLSWKARGLLVYLMSHAENWSTTIGQLVDAAPDGRASVMAGLNELRDATYLIVDHSRGEKGRFEVDYLIVEPVDGVRKSNPVTGSENRHLTGSENRHPNKNTKEEYKGGKNPPVDNPLSSPFCVDHPEGTTTACRPCGDARRAYDTARAGERSKPTPIPPRPGETLEHEHRWLSDGTCMLCTDRRPEEAA